MTFVWRFIHFFFFNLFSSQSSEPIHDWGDITEFVSCQRPPSITSFYPHCEDVQFKSPFFNNCGESAEETHLLEATSSGCPSQGCLCVRGGPAEASGQTCAAGLLGSHVPVPRWLASTAWNACGACSVQNRDQAHCALPPKFQIP